MKSKTRNCFKTEFSRFILFFQCVNFYPYDKNPIWNMLLKFFSAFNIIVMIVLVISADNNGIFTDFSMSMQVAAFVFCGHVFTQLLSIVQTGCTTKKQREIFRKIDEIDEILQNSLGARVEYKFLKRRSVIKIVVIIISFVMFRTLAFEFCGEVNIPYYTVMIIPQFYNQMRCLQNIFYADLINEKVMSMNKKLEEIAEAGYSKLKKNFDDEILDLKFIQSIEYFQ